MAILLPEGKQSFTNALGLPLIGGKVYTYAAGTSTPQPTYSDASGLVANTNPVVLDARGEATIFWNGNYKVVLRDFLDNIIWTVDNVSTIDPLAAVVAALQASLAGAGGAGLIGFQQTGSDLVRTLLAKGREAPVTPDDFSGTDQQKVQAALNARGRIDLLRSYTITEPLTMYGNTHIVGRPGAKLLWSGTPGAYMLGDSSLTNIADINRNIILENFEIDGASLTTGDNHQIGVNFYRTSNVIIRNLIVHGLGGSGIRWGFSQLDTVNVLVEKCQVYDCRYGDAIQGVGRTIFVRENVIGRIGSTTSNFGDTGIALLYDFNTTTNPSGSYTTDVEISGNTIIGNYTLAGVYVGVGQQIQTGIAFGPFQIGHQANIRVIGNTLFGCYLNLWGIVMDDVLITNNNFGSHAATATGNVRIDGITNIRIKSNFITLRLPGAGADYSGILLNAQRNTYGASVFDADISKATISGNEVSSIVPAVIGVRMTFEDNKTGPVYNSKIVNAIVADNDFINVATPVSLAPQAGVISNVCVDVVIQNNKVDAAAGSVVAAGGVGAQYQNVRVVDNSAPTTAPPVSGTGGADIVVRHRINTKVSAASGVATQLFAVPLSGFYLITVYCWVQTGTAAGSSVTQIVSNGGVLDFRNKAEGSAVTFTISGMSVQAVQATGSTNNIYATVTYS